MEILDEKIDEFPLSVGSSHPMTSAGNNQEIESLIGLYQGIDHLHG